MADPADTAEGTGETSKPAAAAGGFTMPVFGGGAAGFAAFSAGAGGFVAPAGGFAPFGGAAPAAAAAGAGAAAGGEEGEEEGAGGDPEAECAAVFKPLVTLDEVVASTGEEEEAALFEAKAKSYRFADEWREKGTGVLKLLQHNDTRKVRLLMRRDKTLKICANFLGARRRGGRERRGETPSRPGLDRPPAPPPPRASPQCCPA